MPPPNDRDSVSADVTLNFDEDQWRAEMTRAANVMKVEFDRALNDVAANFKRKFEAMYNAANAAATQQSQQSRVHGATAARNYSQAFSNNVDLTQGIEGQLDALRKSSQARRGQLSNLGIDPSTFAGVDAQIQEVVRQLNRFKEAQKEGLSPDQAIAWRSTIESALGAARGELRATEQVSRQFLANTNSARSANTARFQQETTLQNAEIRSQANLAIQESQRAGRARIEIARFTFRQIMFFERQLANAIRGSLSAVSSIVAGTASQLSRLGGIFRRSNRDINDGLNGALLQREAAMSRSFRRQTSVVNNEITRQSATIQRFERQASTGIAGAATGRSGIGRLVGGGIAVGAGFRIFQGLRQGFNEAVNLNEAMNAVIQVFGEGTQAVVDFSENSVEALFLTQAETLKAAQSFGVFGRAAGLGGNELAGFSNELTLLATDLASFYNTEVPEAITAIGAALRGESEPIRRFGVLLTEQILQQRAITEGIIDSRRVLQPGERILAAYAEIMATTAVAQGDAARTADDFANASRRARASSVTFFASIAGAAVPIAEVLLRGVIPALEGMTAFVQNNVSPALQVLRTGLIGATTALAGLLAVRGGIEVLQFLGITLRALLTPMGLLITVVGSLGAALAILREQSPVAAEGLARLRDIITGTLSAGLERVVDLATRVATVFRDQVIPVLVGLGVIISQNVIRAFNALVDLFQTRVMPIVGRVGEAIRSGLDAALPVIERVASTIRTILIPALILLGGAWLIAVNPVLGFIAAIGAVSAAFVALRQGGALGGFVENIISDFQNLGRLLVTAIVPQLQNVAEVIRDAFNRIDWESIGLAALGIVFTIGRVVGGIASHPRFVAALAGVAAAAAAVVTAFVAGVATGLASNVPGLIRLVNDTLTVVFREGFKAVLSDPTLFATLIAGAAFISAIRSAFQRIGQQGGGSFVQGLNTGLRRAAGSISGVLTGLFGPGARRQFANAGADAAKTFQREFERTNRNITRLGGAPVRRFDTTVPFNAGDVRRANAAYKQISTTLGEVQSRALLLRSTLRGVFNPSDVARFRQNLGDLFRNINWGQAGQTAAVGFMFGYTAVISGQQGGTAGLAGVTISALSAGLATGNAWVAAGVAAAGLISFMFRDVKTAAEEAAEAVGSFTEVFAGLEGETDRVKAVGDTIVDTIKTQLGEGVGAALLDLFPEGTFASIAADIQAGTFNLNEPFTALLQNLDLTEEQFRTLAAFGPEVLSLEFDSANFASYAGSVTDASAAHKILKDALAEEGVEASDAIELINILNAANTNAAEATEFLASSERALAEARRGGLEGARRRAFEDRASAQAMRQLSTAERELSAVTLERDTRSFFQQTVDSLVGIKTPISDLFNFIVESAREAGQAIDVSLLAELVGLDKATQRAVTQAEASRNALQSLNAQYDHLGPAVSASADEIKLWVEDADKAQDAIHNLYQSFDPLQLALTELNQQRTERINSQIESLNIRLERASAAADEARESLTKFITGNYQDTPSALIDDLIGSLPGIAEALVEAQKLGGERGAAAFRSIIGDLDGDIASIVQAGFEAGMSGNDIKNLFNPLAAALGEVTNPLTAIFDPDNVIIPPEVTNRIMQQIQRDVDPNQIDVNAGAIFDADRNVAAIQKQLDARQAELDVEVRFSESQIEQALRDNGLDQRVIDFYINPVAVATAQGTPIQQQIAEFNNALSISQGILSLLLGNAPTGAPITNYNIFPLNSTNATEIGRSAADKIAEQSAAAGGAAPKTTAVYVPNRLVGAGVGSNIPV